MLKIKKNGQTALEYVVLIVIILGAFLAAGNYFKRGLQGRWRAAVDDMGDQYDPRFANSSITQTLQTNVVTTIIALNSVGGFYTFRSDYTNSVEQKTGFTAVGAY